MTPIESVGDPKERGQAANAAARGAIQGAVLAMRASGRRVYYQPESVVVHSEGATSGTDPNAGAKRHQTRNRQTFRTKWRGALGALPEPPARYSGLVWQRLAWTGGAA